MKSNLSTPAQIVVRRVVATSATSTPMNPANVRRHNDSFRVRSVNGAIEVLSTLLVRSPVLQLMIN